MKRQMLVAVGIAWTGMSFAALKLGTPFADGMVLQREMKVPVWGSADAGAAVTVSFAGQKVRARAGADGEWRVDLAPLVASKEGRRLTVSSASETITLDDVLVGEVWYCSGQSNAEFPMYGPDVRFRDRNGSLVAQMTDKPCVRFVRAICGWSDLSVRPEKKPRYSVAWKRFNEQNLRSGTSFSAMGAYFALELYSALDVPIGIVGSYAGSSGIDPWTPTCGTASRPDLKDILNRPYYTTLDEWNAAPAEMKRDPFLHLLQQRAILWNAMVETWCPMAMRGFIWYQGCANAKEPERYCSKMHALYNGWSQKFENPDLKLCFVQLTAWGFPGIPYIQEAQARFAAEERNASMTVINDVGNLADIHPRDKELVAKRLAIHALKEAYGWNVHADSPTLAKWEIRDGQFLLDFDHATGFYIYYDDQRFESCEKQQGFEVAGGDGVWKPATIANLHEEMWRRKMTKMPRVVGSRLVVASSEVKEPVKLRYIHTRPWKSRIYNEYDLPMGAFSVDAGGK